MLNHVSKIGHNSDAFASQIYKNAPVDQLILIMMMIFTAI